MVELPSLYPAFDNILEFPGVITGGSLFCHFKMSFDDIVYIPQKQSSSLLDIPGGTEIQIAGSPFHHSAYIAGRNRGLDLVAAQVGEVNGGTDMNAVDHPGQPRMPVDGFDQPRAADGVITS